MGRVSRRHLNKFMEDRIYAVFWEHLALLKTPSLIKEFLHSLLSATEQVMLAKRLAIALLLSRGYTYKEIDEAIKVSKATVATIHRQLLVGAPGYTKAIKTIQDRKTKEARWDALEETLLKLSLPARYGSNKYRVKSQIGKELYKRKLNRSQL